MKEHTACWRKGEETLTKLLKEGKDTGDFAIEGKDKGEVWKRERKKVSQDKRRRGKKLTHCFNLNQAISKGILRIGEGTLFQVK